MARVVLDEAAIAALATDPQILAAVGDVADRFAATLAGAAPKRTGASARSVHAEPAPNPADGFRVSWDRQHFYVSLAHGLDFVDRAISQFR